MTMTKKSTQLFWHWLIDWRIIFWLNVSSFLSPMDKVLVDGLARVRSQWFGFSLWSACRSKCICFQRKIFELHLGGFLRCPRPPCCSSPWPTCLSHEKFWPRSENCLCSQIQFWFPLHIYLVGNWLWLPLRAELLCSLESNLLGQMIFHLLAKCTHDMLLVL